MILFPDTTSNIRETHQSHIYRVYCHYTYILFNNNKSQTHSENTKSQRIKKKEREREMYAPYTKSKLKYLETTHFTFKRFFFFFLKRIAYNTELRKKNEHVKFKDLSPDIKNLDKKKRPRVPIRSSLLQEKKKSRIALYDKFIFVKNK